MESRTGEASQTKAPESKPKQGFSVGPANLPDGSYRRKAQKIKKRLIQNAQIKRSYAKLKDREAKDSRPTNNFISSASGQEDVAAASMELHPARQAMLRDGEEAGRLVGGSTPPQVSSRRKRPKGTPFNKETQEAKRRKEERESRNAAIEESMRQRNSKREEREQFRRTMAKARTGGRNHDQRKLGRESKVLLAKVQRLVQERP